MPRSERHFAYLAGLLDGEGNIGVYRSRNSKGYWGYSANLNVANTDRRLMKYLVLHFGGVFHKKPKGYVWEPNGGKARMKTILLSVLPHVTVKSTQAKLVLDFFDLGRKICPALRERFYNRTMELNQTGVPRASVLPETTKANWAYLAALLDGEGHIRLTKTKQYSWAGVCYNKSITIPNCDKSLMVYLTRHFGGVFKPSRRIKNPNPNKAPSYVWSIFGNELQETLLLAVLPYMLVKKRAATKVLSFLRLKGQQVPAKREKLYQEFRLLRLPPETNTSSCPENGQKIESNLTGDHECDPAVTLAS